MVTEALDVCCPQLGAVAVAEEVDLVVAQGLAHRIHVPCGRSGPDVLQERRTVPGLTALSYLPVHLLDVRHTLRAVVDHRFAPVGVELGVSLAAQPRRGVADATRIEPDQIESLSD